MRHRILDKRVIPGPDYLGPQSIKMLWILFQIFHEIFRRPKNRELVSHLPVKVTSGLCVEVDSRESRIEVKRLLQYRSEFMVDGTKG